MKRYNDALKIQRALESNFAEPGAAKDGYVYEELGELFLLQGEKKESRRYFALAYDLLSNDEWLKANEAKRLDRIKEFAEGK